MAIVTATLRSAGTYTINHTGSFTCRSWGVGGPGGGSQVNGGGGGSGGCLARSSPTASGTITVNNAAVPASVTGPRAANSWVSTTGVAPTSASQGCLAPSGIQGGNGTTLQAGAAGIASTSGGIGDLLVAGQNGSAGTLGAGGDGGDGASGDGYSGGLKGTGATAVQGSVPAAPGAGAGGAALGSRRFPAAGYAHVEFDTGLGQVSHVATMVRRLTLSRAISGLIAHTSVFFRVLSINRAFQSLISLTPRAVKQVLLSRLATIAHEMPRTIKNLTLSRLGQILHSSVVQKTIVLSVKIASVTHQAIFARAVILRRAFLASISHTNKVYVFIEARLIPRGTGIIQIVKRVFSPIFDD